MKPTLLLHICCAPCSIALLEELAAVYSVTGFFYNPNIFPQEEFEKRLSFAKNICAELGIPLIEEEYDPRAFNSAAAGLEREPEGGRRCVKCFRLRLNKTAEYAALHGFSFFASTLTSGRNKKADVINALGEQAARDKGGAFLAGDWKKGGRQERATTLAKDKLVYRQHYCGCCYSIRDV